MLQLFRNLRIWQKLTLVVVAFAIPLLVMLYLLEHEMSVDIKKAQMEKRGVEALKLLNELTGQVRAHEALVQSGANRDAARDQIDRSLKELRDLNARAGGDFSGQLKPEDLEVKRNAAVAVPVGTKGADAQTPHDNFLQAIREQFAKVGAGSQLTLDGDPGRSYLVSVVLDDIPESEGYLARAGQAAEDAATRKVNTPDQRSAIASSIEVLRNNADGLRRGNADALKLVSELAPGNPAIAALKELAGPLDAFISKTGAYCDLVASKVVNAETITVAPEDLAKPRAEVRASRINFANDVLDRLDGLLDGEISAQTQHKYTWLVVVLAIVGLALAFTIFVIRSITRPLAKAVGAANRLAGGDLDADVMADSTDEPGQLLVAMGDMVDYLRASADVSDSIAAGELGVRVVPKSETDRFGNSFRNMLESTLGLVQSREERDRIQRSVEKLSGEVKQVAGGDLTIDAEVTADITGPIAEAVNAMIGQLREIIHSVKEATLHVSAASNELQATTEDLANGAESQSSQIVDTSSALEEMVVSIAQVSENAGVASSVANQALASSRQGTKAVQNTIRGMSRIRHQVQETAKRIKRLGERSQEIGEIVQLIGDIADRTSILALNASIQAAMAGEAGRGFAVVAEEVERLADRSTNATKQIAGLVKSIQSETNEAVSAMEETTREVVDGSTVANEAGQALTEIEGVSNRLAELINSITMASKQQARGSEALAGSMSEISEVTQQAAAATKEAAVAVRNLVTLAEELRGSVVAFRLPEGDAKAVAGR